MNGDGVSYDGGPYRNAEAVVVLPCTDLDRAELWYGRIGFAVTATYPDYRLLAAGGLRVHLRHAAVDECGGSGVYLYLDDPQSVTELNAAWVAAGVSILAPPTETTHGLFEMVAEDLDGNLWRVGAPMATRVPLAGDGATVEDDTNGEIDQPVEVDWFSVVTSGACPSCELNASEGPAASLGGRIRDEAHRWTTVLKGASDDSVRFRPEPQVWSALEYGVHVRDVLAVFTERVMVTLVESEPELGWWDHEAAIIEGFANESDCQAVSDDLAENAARLAEALARVSGDDWDRSATRRGYERFTVELLARYALHEVTHHRADAERSLDAGGREGAA